MSLEQTTIALILAALAILYPAIFGGRGLVDYFQHRRTKRELAVQEHRSKYLPQSNIYTPLLESVRQSLAQGKNQVALKAIQQIPIDRQIDDVDPLSEATRIYYEGEAKTNLGQKEAIKLLRESIRLAESVSPTEPDRIHYKEWIIGRSHHDVGYMLKTFKNDDAAVVEYLIALPHLHRSANRSAYARTLKNLAFIYARQGKLIAAELICRDALKIFREIGDKSGEALSENTLGLIFESGRKYSLAQLLCKQALAKFESEKDSRGIGLACTGLGRILRRLSATGDYPSEVTVGFFREAKQLLERSKEIFEGPDSEPSRLIEVYNELGCAYRDWAKFYIQSATEIGQADELETCAVEHLEKSYHLASENKMLAEVADTLEDLAELEFNRADIENARERLKRLDAIIPKEYWIAKTFGMPHISEPVAEYWAILGKAHLLRGHIAFDCGQQLEAAEKYVLASIYFGLYSETSPFMDFAMPSIYSRLRKLDPSEIADWRLSANRFQSGFGATRTKLMEVLDETMGILELNAGMSGT